MILVYVLCLRDKESVCKMMESPAGQVLYLGEQNCSSVGPECWNQFLHRASAVAKQN